MEMKDQHPVIALRVGPAMDTLINVILFLFISQNFYLCVFSFHVKEDY